MDQDFSPLSIFTQPKAETKRIQSSGNSLNLTNLLITSGLLACMGFDDLHTDGQ